VPLRSDLTQPRFADVAAALGARTLSAGDPTRRVERTILIARTVGRAKSFFEVESYRVIVERNASGQLVAEASVKLRVNGETRHTVADCTGPVGALDKALRLALEPAYPQLRDVTLRDYKVRILDGRNGANARTRVLIESGTDHRVWGPVGVSDNVIDASWEALVDAVNFKLALV
jgi:2-isopropylmalate synthase